ncbi:TBC1 domain family member 2B [Lamellibrachia satsuma]|nr:TBC1 domain family member 2B [Lamellibrachia satsuma]
MFQTQLRIWDCFLLEGPKVLFRFSLAVLKWNESVLLQKTDMLSTLRHLKACTNLMFDANTLVKLAFEDMQPFTHRHQLASKQLLYLDRIKDSLLISEDKHRRLTSQEEKMLDVSDVGLLYECAAHWADGECRVDYDEHLSYAVTF